MQSDADGLAVAVVLILELAEIARVLMCFKHAASFVVNANHSVTVFFPCR